MEKKRGNIEGSLFKRKNGTWRAHVSVNGERLSFTGKSQRECREWIKQTINQLDTGLTFYGAQISFGEFLLDWLVSTKASLRLKTWDQYQQIVCTHILHDLGKIKLIELRPDHIQSLYEKNSRRDRTSDCSIDSR